MQFKEFQLQRGDTGLALPYGTLTVYLTGTTAKASLFNAIGGSISNPITADGNALVGFAAVNGTYDYLIKSADAVYQITVPKQQVYDLEGIANALAAGTVAGLVSKVKDTKANLFADLAAAASTLGLVYADPTPLNNDLYVKLGSSGSGSWQGPIGAIPSAIGVSLTDAILQIGSDPALDIATATSGRAGDGADGTIPAPDIHYCYGPAAVTPSFGLISTVGFYMGGSGSVEILVLAPTGTLDHWTIFAIIPTAVTAGANSVTINQYAPAGSAILIRTTVGPGNLRYTLGAPVGRQVILATTAVGDSVTTGDWSAIPAVTFVFTGSATNLEGRVTSASAAASSALASAVGSRLMLAADSGSSASVIGSTSDVSSATALDYVYPSPFATPVEGVLGDIRFVAGASGFPIKVIVAKPIGDGTYTITNVSLTLTSNGGLYTYSGFSGIEVPKGSLIATVDGGLAAAKSGNGGFGLRFTKASFSTVGQNSRPIVSPYTPAISYDLTTSPKNALTRLDELEARAKKAPLVLIDETFAGSTLPGDWTATGWTVSDGITPPASGGVGVTALNAKASSIDRKTIETRFTLGSTDAKFAICVDPAADNSQGIVVMVDGPAAFLKLYYWDSTGTLGTVFASVAIPGGFLVAGKEYLLQAKKDRYTTTITLTNVLSQVSISASDTTANTLAHGYPGLMYISGTTAPKFTRFRVRSPYDAQVHALVLGDSIGEANYLYDGSHLSPGWAQQFQNAQAALGRTVIVAARSSEEFFPSFAERKAYDFDQWRPKYVFIAIGTNDITQGAWRLAVQQLVWEAQHRGIEPILCTQPPRGDGGAGGSAVHTAMNDDIRSGFFGAIRYVDFAKALTTGNDGVTWNPSLDYGDHVHPNLAGQVVMFNQVPIDLPDIAT